MHIHIRNQVQECSTGRGKEPQIVIQGGLLPEFGFEIGTRLLVKLEKERITITPSYQEINCLPK
jgi:hypothetical protein